MELISMVGKWALVIFAVVNVAVAVYTHRNESRFFWTIWKRVRPLMVLESMAVVIAVITSAITMCVFIPYLKWGWTNLFFKGGGNILLSPALESMDSSHGWVKYLVLAFLALFVLVTPFLTKAEEEMFRKGHYEIKDVMKKSVGFGLIHLTVGIPIAAALAIIGAGFFFGWKYRKAFLRLTQKGMYYWEAEEEAVLVSTTYHTLYNTFAVAFIILIVLFL